MPPRILPTQEAAGMKGCSGQAILDAIDRGAIDGERLGREFFVHWNKKFRDWQPNPRRQKAGRESQKPKKLAARKRQ